VEFYLIRCAIGIQRLHRVNSFIRDGGKTFDRINATDVIWNFFQKHPVSVKDGDPAQTAPADADKVHR
jgi:hypothetical protein